MPNADAELRVLHIVAPGAFGGVETVVQALTASLAARGMSIEVVLVVPNGSSPLADLIASAGVRVHLIALAHRDYAGQWRALRTVIRERAVSIVHSHGYHADILARLAAAAEHVAWVSTAHGFTGGALRSRFYQFLQRRSWRSADAVIAVSQPLARQLGADGIRPARLHCIPNALAPSAGLGRTLARAALGLPLAGRAIGWIGRLSHEKAPSLAVQAFAKVTAPDVRLVFVGDGPERGALAALVDQLGLTARVHQVGARAGARAMLGAFDLLLLSSSTEGTPMVVLEAMEAGVPVVATDVGGVRDLIGGDNAWLVPPGDAAALSGALSHALSEPDEARSRAVRAAERFRAHYQADAWAERHAVLYAALRQPKARAA